jgi:hypothetical protein
VPGIKTMLRANPATVRTLRCFTLHLHAREETPLA